MGRQHVVILIHGIKDFAVWQDEVTTGLKTYASANFDDETLVVKSLGYGYFDALRFLAPVPYFRNSATEEVYTQIKAIRKDYPNALISVICHSFGTYVIGRILITKFESAFYKIILTGSIQSRRYPWFVFSSDR